MGLGRQGGGCSASRFLATALKHCVLSTYKYGSIHHTYIYIHTQSLCIYLYLLSPLTSISNTPTRLVEIPAVLKYERAKQQPNG